MKEREILSSHSSGKSNNYFVFVLPIAEELDLKKAAKVVCEKNVEMIHVKDINKITGYISGGRIGAQLILAPEDLIEITSAIVSDICI